MLIFWVGNIVAIFLNYVAEKVLSIDTFSVSVFLLFHLQYIHYNPLSWELDRENPNCIGIDEFDNWLIGYMKRINNNVS